MVVISSSPIRTLPEVGLSSPARMCMRVDLPDPDGPITAVSCPAGTSRDTPRSASTADSPSPKRRVTSQAPTTGLVAPAPSERADVASVVMRPRLAAHALPSQGGFHPAHRRSERLGEIVLQL